MILLSIDWDYFFPEMEEFDWGMQEKPIFHEFIWHTRYYSTGLINRKPAYKVMLPKYDGFLRRILAYSDIERLVITDNHADIQMLIENFKVEELWNFDAHHDCGYRKNENEIHCGNWGKLIEDISTYKLIYPKYRLSKPETYIPEIFDIYYDMPPIIPSFDTVFICRSSCITPSWCDDYFIDFIDYLRIMHIDAWQSKIALDYVMKPRRFDLKSAEVFKMK